MATGGQLRVFLANRRLPYIYGRRDLLLAQMKKAVELQKNFVELQKQFYEWEVNNPEEFKNSPFYELRKPFHDAQARGEEIDPPNFLECLWVVQQKFSNGAVWGRGTRNVLFTARRGFRKEDRKRKKT
jgi:hypothetical protein